MLDNLNRSTGFSFHRIVFSSPRHHREKLFLNFV